MLDPISNKTRVVDDAEMSSSARRSHRIWESVIHPERRPHGIRLLVAVLILVVAALPVRRSGVSNVELEVFRFLNDLPDGLEPAMKAVMQLGSLLAVPLAALVALAYARKARRGVDLLLAGSLAWVAARLIKDVFQRGRPAALLDDVRLRVDAAAGFGFVSGHAAVAAALATVAAFYLPMGGKVLVWALAVLVGIARIYVGAHLPLDVVGGLAVGWAIGSLVHFVLLPELTGGDMEAAAT